MTEPTNCQQCGNPLSETAVKKEAVYCDRCWNVIADYHYINDFDEFEEFEEDTYDCPVCGAECGDGWATCSCQDDYYAECDAEEEPTP